MNSKNAPITITHSHTDGTLIEGSCKGDGVFEIVRNHGFSYFPSIRALGIRGSRDKDAQRWRIDAAAQALRIAGHDVEIDIDDQWRPTAERETDRAARAEERAERYDDRSQRAQERSDDRYKKSRQTLDHIPPGQPLLVDHYSYPRHHKALERAHANMDASVREERYANDLARRAEAAASHQRHRENPRVTMRRVDRLEAESRRMRRNGLDTAHVDEEITHWKEHLAALEVTGEFVPWKPEHFRKGDHVRIRGTWYPVVRVNKKTITVSVSNRATEQSTFLARTDTAPYDEVFGRRRDGQQLDTPNGDERPVNNPDA